MRVPNRSVTGKVISTVATIASAFTFGACDKMAKIVDPVDPCAQYLARVAHTAGLEVPATLNYFKVTMSPESLGAKIASSPSDFEVMLEDVTTGNPVKNYAVIYEDDTLHTNDNGIARIQYPNAIREEDECLERARIAGTPRVVVYMLPQVVLQTTKYTDLLDFLVKINASNTNLPRPLRVMPHSLPAKVFFVDTKNKYTDAQVDDLAAKVLGNASDYVEPSQRTSWDNVGFNAATGLNLFQYIQDTTTSKADVIVYLDSGSATGFEGGGDPFNPGRTLRNDIILTGGVTERGITDHEMTHVSDRTDNYGHSKDRMHIRSGYNPDANRGNISPDEVPLIQAWYRPVIEGNAPLDLRNYSLQ